MVISTSTNILSYIPDPRIVSVEETMERCAAAGFSALDMNFCNSDLCDYTLAIDDWETWVRKIRRKADAMGIAFPMCHAPFYNVCEPLSLVDNKDAPTKAAIEELIRRSIIAAGMLDIHWIVLHAGTAKAGGVHDDCLSLEKNIDYFRPHLEFAKSCGCGIAIENMPEFFLHDYHFTNSVKKLIQLVDAFHDDAVGICWDFGHANLTDERQVDSIRSVGHRLKVTHVADNNGISDQHLLPYNGNVPWNEILPTLGEIGYEGPFNFEIHSQSRYVPDTMRDEVIRYTYKLGEYMVSQIDLARKEGKGA